MFALLRALALLTAFSAVAACGGSNASVITDHDPDASFDHYRTFDLLGEGSGLEEDRIDVEQIEGWIEANLEATLVEKGYERVTDGTADFMVGYHIGLNGALSVRTMNTGYRYQSGWGWNNWGMGSGPSLGIRDAPGGQQSYREYYDEGTVVIDVMDRESRTLVWRAAVRGEVDMNRAPNERRHGIERVVHQLLRNFPP
ncbi:MAG: DUF4136 domain-containing protein [Deltaproteobacteria bacterium]|nr:DUF4136 domain-containing protein [Deltaproteobacteria bacterium]